MHYLNLVPSLPKKYEHLMCRFYIGTAFAYLAYQCLIKQQRVYNFLFLVWLHCTHLDILKRTLRRTVLAVVAALFACYSAYDRVIYTFWHGHCLP